jgi:hypothetical protein
VGEFAAWLALQRGGRTFYTTPIKALSNQKYADFVTLHGAARVGLLTGDNSINGDAPIVVMTTEVLRNMIYDDADALDDLHHVVLDEVHYLQDPYRGAVWEEILIHLPVDVQTVSLSATVSNAEEFGEWLQTLRGRVEVIIEERRPVDIRHWYFAADELQSHEPKVVAAVDTWIRQVIGERDHARIRLPICDIRGWVRPHHEEGVPVGGLGGGARYRGQRKTSTEKDDAKNARGAERGSLEPGIHGSYNSAEARASPASPPVISTRPSIRSTAACCHRCLTRPPVRMKTASSTS